MPPRARKTVPPPAAVESASDVAEQPWATHTLRGREITFVQPTPEQLMVLRRLSRQLDTPVASRRLITLAKMLDATSACMGSDAEREYVDQLVLDRIIDLGDLTPMITVALLGTEGVKEAGKLEAPKTGPVKRVRRS